MVHSPVRKWKIVFSSSIELSGPGVFRRWTTMASILVAIVDHFRMMHVDLSGGRNRYETSAKIDWIMLQL